MTMIANAAAERIDGQRERYCDVADCAARYGFSQRHWLRLVDRGRAPQPTRFGRLCRWSLTALDAWERDGCPPIRVSRKAVTA